MQLNRRQALQVTGAVSTTSVFQPRGVFADTAPTKMLRVAAVGIAGRGKADLQGMQSHPRFALAAIADVDRRFHNVADSFGDDVLKFQDYREMFDRTSDSFDAVLIATPDHMHAPIAKLALEHDKHVYLQKPLCQDVGECRVLAEIAAAKPQLATQMGIQVHSHSDYQTAVSWIQSGLIGKVREVHSWSGKGWGGRYPRAIPTPIPEELDWDLYCGVAPKLPYVKDWYHRNNWRKWIAFGTGTQGDMGCHILDPVFSALQIRKPTSVQSLGPQPFELNFALNNHIAYMFEATQHTDGDLKLTWYNGALRPKELPGLPTDIELPGQGSVLIGEFGSLVLPHVASPDAYRTDGSRWDPKQLPATLPSVSHFHEWIDVALGEAEQTGAPFGYAGQLTEAILLGNIINRWPGVEFQWDANACQFTGKGLPVDEANQLIAPKYRDNFVIPVVG